MKSARLVDYHLNESGVGILTLNNPPLNLNTIGSVDKLLRLCNEIAEDDRVRVVVITGAGQRAFCAGSDITEFADVLDDVAAKKLARENDAFTAIEHLPQPVIAALNGVTLGGGAEIALACDIRIIESTGRIGFPEVNLGVFPGSGGVFRLPRLVGLPRAYELLYSGESITADECLRIGLVNKVVAHGRALESALSIAAKLASKPALALSLIRSAARESLGQSTAMATERTLADSHTVFTGPDVEEGISAFFGKRQPTFTAGRRDSARLERTPS